MKVTLTVSDCTGTVHAKSVDFPMTGPWQLEREVHCLLNAVLDAHRLEYDINEP